MLTIRSILTFFVLASIAGCGSKPDSFTLPKGDAERGQAVFIKFRCYDCHEIRGVELPVSDEPNQVRVELGGHPEHLKSYTDLVTSIINPSHRLAKGYNAELVSHDGKSNMTIYNDVMTVTQLCDIVAFLQAHYELRQSDTTTYRDYGTK
jgi:sulfur-oxidizing protein SoxX